MEFEWDPLKSERTFQTRGFDFVSAAAIFGGFVVEAMDWRHDYGEVRVKAIGRTGALVLVVIYTDRGGTRRIISARKAKEKERLVWLRQCG